MRTTALLLALTAAPALAGPEVALERKANVGERVRVAETHRTHLELMWRGERAAVGGAEVEATERRYDQEVRVAQPERLHRTYELSTRVKHKPGESVEPERTSLHGRAILVQGLTLEPDGPFEISKDDREALRWDRLVQALLPPQKTATRGEEWEVPGEAIGQALFGRYIAPANLEGSGARVQLRSLKKAGDQQVAVLRVRALAVKIAKVEGLPELDLQLRGEVEWAVEEGALLSARLEGPGRYVARVGKARLEAEGTMSYAYRAELLEPRLRPSDADREAGAPPPPGTRTLICEHEPAHRMPIHEFVRCIQCGAELDGRRSCREHGWVLQRCPHDGGRLRPE